MAKLSCCVFFVLCVFSYGAEQEADDYDPCMNGDCPAINRMSLIWDSGNCKFSKPYNPFCRNVNIFVERNTNLTNTVIYSIERTPLQFLGEFYRSCFEVEFEEIDVNEEVEKFIDGLGGFGNNNTSKNLTELLAILLKRQTMPLFEVGITINESSTLQFHITLPGKSHLPVGIKGWSALSRAKQLCVNRQILESSEVEEKYRECVIVSYLNSIESILEQLKYFKGMSSVVRPTKIFPINYSIEMFMNITTAPNFVEKSNWTLLHDLDHYSFLNLTKLLGILASHDIDPLTTKIKIDDSILELFHKLEQKDSSLLYDIFLSIYAADLFQHATFIGQKSNRGNHQCLDLSKRLLPDLYAHQVETAFPDLYDVTNSRTYMLIEKQNIVDLEFKTYSSKAVDNTAYSNIQSRTFGGMLRELMSLSQENYYKIEGEKINSQTLFFYFVDLLSLKPIKLLPNGFIAIPIGYQMLMKAANEELPNYLEISQIGFHLIREVVRYQKPNITNFANFDLNYTVTAFNRPNITVSSLSMDDIAEELSAYELTTRILENVKNDETYNFCSQRSLTFDQLTTVATIQEYCINMDLQDYMWEKYEDKTVTSLALSKKFIDVLAMNKNKLQDSV